MYFCECIFSDTQHQQFYFNMTMECMTVEILLWRQHNWMSNALMNLRICCRNAITYYVLKGPPTRLFISAVIPWPEYLIAINLEKG